MNCYSFTPLKKLTQGIFMRGMPSRWSGTLLLAFCMALPMSACQAGAGDTLRTISTSSKRQLIVKFKPGTVECSASGIAKFAGTTATHIEFLRVMSGDACVVSQFLTAGQSAASEQEMLNSHPAIQWIESDSPLKAQ